jgi:NAD(P)-dependent dehydrogenase (short-subunit alcohol dehydrogenase family)
VTLPEADVERSTGRLLGKRALVTGGSRSLGRVLCRTFARAGARVAFTYTRDEETSKATLEEIATAGGGRSDGRAYRVSASDTEGTEKLVAELDRDWGGLDILVNNAGVTQNLPLALLEEEDFDRVIRVNVKGTFVTSKAVLRSMMRRKSGVILNIGSLAGERMIEAPIHYSTSKAAIRGMTESMAKEVARHGVRVLNLAPGLLEDGVGRNLPDYRLADYLKHCALGRVGTFDEVAELAAFLVSDAASYMTGETIVMDGGV